MLVDAAGAVPPRDRRVEVAVRRRAPGQGQLAAGKPLGDDDLHQLGAGVGGALVRGGVVVDASVEGQIPAAGQLAAVLAVEGEVGDLEPALQVRGLAAEEVAGGIVLFRQ